MPHADWADQIVGYHCGEERGRRPVDGGKRMARGGDRGSRGERIRDKIDYNAAEDRASNDHRDVRGGGLASDKRCDGRERHRVHRRPDHQEHKSEAKRS